VFSWVSITEAQHREADATFSHCFTICGTKSSPVSIHTTTEELRKKTGIMRNDVVLFDCGYEGDDMYMIGCRMIGLVVLYEKDMQHERVNAGLAVKS
jgi:hypothetical protein